MVKKYDFSNGKWSMDDFFFCYSPLWKSRKEFLQEENSITNNYDDGKPHYISILTKEKYKTGVHLRAKCSFQSFGAPLIVISGDVSPNEAGEMQYGLHFEAVAWYKGLNVWRVIPWPERVVRPIHSTLIGTDDFTIENDAVVEIDVVVREKELYVGIDGHYITVPHDEIPETFHVGITACEGFNRFYEFSIEE